MTASRAPAIRAQSAAAGLAYPVVALPGPRAVEVFIASQRVDRLPRRDSSFTALILRNTRVRYRRAGSGAMVFIVPRGTDRMVLGGLVELGE